MAYLQIYKNKPNAIFTHSVLKGDDLYEVNIIPDKPMRWRYIGKVDPKIYQVSGTLIRKPSLKMITILQRDLQPKRVNEAFKEGSIWRSASQEWLKEFIDNEGYIDHKDKFISFSFDTESGGQDNFGGREVVIEFDKEIILSQAHEQGLGEIEYTSEFMEENPLIALHVLGFENKEDYLDSLDDENYPNKEEYGDDYWEYNIESYEHEKEIILRELIDEEGLIKNIVFYKPADINLVNKLKRKGIPYILKAGLKNDPQKKLQFESFRGWLNEYFPGSFREKIFYHGSTDKNLSGKKGIHVGTYQAAKEALEARIGIPAEGEWDGTREYGNTLLAGKKTIAEKEKKTGKFCSTGFNCGPDVPQENYYAKDRKYRAQYSDGTPIPFDSKPIIFPVKITGEMSNTPFNPHADEKANSMMLRNLKMGNARRGYYYKNIGEDEGSISAVVPDKSFLQIL